MGISDKWVEENSNFLKKFKEHHIVLSLTFQKRIYKKRWNFKQIPDHYSIQN